MELHYITPMNWKLYFAVTPKSKIMVQTVHGVKGETHDATIFVCPSNIKANRCPSSIWWSANEKDREEKRIAYVAMTRTQGNLVLCVHEASYKRLSEMRGAFVGGFESKTVDEFVKMAGLPENSHALRSTLQGAVVRKSVK